MKRLSLYPKIHRRPPPHGPNLFFIPLALPSRRFYFAIMVQAIDGVMVAVA